MSAVKIHPLTTVSDVRHALMKALAVQRKSGVKQKAVTQGYTQSLSKGSPQQFQVVILNQDRSPENKFNHNISV